MCPRDSEHRFQNLLLYTGFPAFDGQNNPQSEEITDNVELIRNVLYYTMKKSGFHGSETEFLHAQSLYPDLFTRFAR